MARTAKKRPAQQTRLPDPPVQSGTPTIKWGQLARIAAAAFLVLFGVWVCKKTTERVQAEFLWREARTLKSNLSYDREAEIRLRRAYRLDPYSPGIAFDLAATLINRETRLFEDRSSPSADNIREAIRLLGEIRDIHFDQPHLAKLRGSAALLLARTYRRQGDEEASDEMFDLAFRELLSSVRMLPVPRERHGDLKADLLVAAQMSGREDIAVEFLHEFYYHRMHWVLDDRRLGSHSVQAAFRMGLFPMVVREARQALLKDAEDGLAVQQLALAAGDLDQREAVINTLDQLQETGQLSLSGLALMEKLTGAPSAPLDRTPG